jgi:O-acetyl-ADP-ribose deacetylase (regulator of RNase III)
MITYVKGDILASNAQALINTVNTVGVMGKGIALQFKKAFPTNFKEYTDACKRGEVIIGKLFVIKDKNLNTGEKIIINFPTKTDWRKPSEYSYIENGLSALIHVIQQYNIQSIAIPALGAGNGGLEWEKVKKMIEKKLNGIETDVFIYEPTQEIKEHLIAERIKLTDARALLLYVLYDLVRNGEFVSEFSSEKICYFLQRFGARKFFRLDFEPNFYGPYSGKVRFILNVLNGSYVTGYSDMNKKPFDPLTLVGDGYDTVKNYVEANPELNTIANATMRFLNGFYSDFALELLSSIDYITKSKTFDIEIITKQLEAWSDRKRSLFSEKKYIEISTKHLQEAHFVWE